MTGATGLEPATSAVTGQRSNLLSYAPAVYPEGRGCLPRLPSMPGAGGRPLLHDLGQLASFD
jgi:hypothetical protein